MAIARIIYFPAKGENNSPIDILYALCDVKERTHFTEKLRSLCELDISNWNFKWLEHFDEMYQVKQGNFRLYFEIINGVIVVCHVCRKVAMKAETRDIRRAKLNLQLYRGK